MNPAITAALIAASREEEVKEKIEGRLEKAQATSPGRAITLEFDKTEQELLDQALATGTVKQSGDGRFYLHEQAIADRNEGHGFMALLILLAVASVTASVAVLVARSGG